MEEYKFFFVGNKYMLKISPNKKNIMFFAISIMLIWTFIWLLYKSTNKPINKSIKKTLSSLYTDDLYHSIPENEVKLIDSENNFSSGSVYGEITENSFKKVLDSLSINKNDIIYDLGSGRGKTVTQAYLLTPAKCIGIELSKTRHKIALRAKKILKANSRLQFLNKNMLKCNLSNATIVYLCSTCFSDDLLKNIVNKLTRSKHKVTIISLKKLSESPKIRQVKTLQIKTSWTDNTSCTIYETIKE
jgi:hypothetical protein